MKTLGAIGCGLIFVGLLWGMLLNLACVWLTVLGVVITGFTAYYWPEDKENK